MKSAIASLTIALTLIGLLLTAPPASAAGCSTREESPGHITSNCLSSPVDLVYAPPYLDGRAGFQAVNLNGSNGVKGRIGSRVINLTSSFGGTNYSGKVGKFKFTLEPDDIFGGWECTIYKARWQVYRVTPQLIGDGYSINEGQGAADCIALVAATGQYNNPHPNSLI